MKSILPNIILGAAGFSRTDTDPPQGEENVNLTFIPLSGDLPASNLKTGDEMVGWYHQLNGHEFEQTPGDGEGQEGLPCCSP